MRINVRKELRQLVTYGAPFYGFCNIMMFYISRSTSYGRVPDDFYVRYPYYEFRWEQLSIYLATAYIATGLIAIFWKRGLVTILAIAAFQLGFTVLLSFQKVILWHDIVVPMVALTAGGWVLAPKKI